MRWSTANRRRRRAALKSQADLTRAALDRKALIRVRQFSVRVSSMITWLGLALETMNGIQDYHEPPGVSSAQEVVMATDELHT